MWACPKCGARFVSKNLWHSCGNYTLDQFLQGKTKRSVELFEYFLLKYRKIGPITLHPVKTRVALMVEVRFAAIYRIGKDYIQGTLWLKEQVDDLQFFRVDKFGGKDFIHHFRISDESDMDSRFTKFMRMAYAVGQRKHLRAKKVDRSRSPAPDGK